MRRQRSPISDPSRNSSVQDGALVTAITPFPQLKVKCMSLHPGCALSLSDKCIYSLYSCISFARCNWRASTSASQGSPVGIISIWFQNSVHVTRRWSQLYTCAMWDVFCATILKRTGTRTAPFSFSEYMAHSTWDIVTYLTNGCNIICKSLHLTRHRQYTHQYYPLAQGPAQETNPHRLLHRNLAYLWFKKSGRLFL